MYMKLKLKDEYKTAVIGGYDGKLQIELLFVEEGLYPRIYKDYPHFFIIEDEPVVVVKPKKTTTNDIPESSDL